MSRLSSTLGARRKKRIRINRVASPWRAAIVPYASIMLGSLLPVLVIADAMPALPPMGYLMLLCWRIIRPGLLPMWVGVPLGMFDDLFSGQPFGSAVLLWSLTMIAIEAVETRFPWRGFFQDWFTAGLAVFIYIFAAMLISGAPASPYQLIAATPQLLLSALLYPVFARFVAGLDAYRLTPTRRIG